MSASTVSAPARTRDAATAEAAPRSGLSSYARWMTAISAIALVGRLLYLQRFSFWRDEAFTGVVVRRSWTAMFDAVRGDSAPPLGYIISHVVAGVSSDPWALRLVSVMAGTAAVPIAGALARRMGGDRAGLLGAAVVAVTPPLVISSRDARMYALATTLVMLCALTLWRALERPSRQRQLVYGVCVMLAVYTHYFAAIGVVAQLAVAGLLRPEPRAWRRAGVAALLAALTLVPWLIAASAQFDHAGVPFWVRPVGFDGILGTFTVFAAGQAVDDANPARMAIVVFQAGAIVGCFIGLCAAAVALWRADAARRRAIVYVACCALVAVTLIVLISLRQSFLEWRYTGVVWGPFFALVGLGLARLRPHLLGGLCVGAMASASFALMLGFTRGPDMPSVTAYLDQVMQPGDQVVLPSPANYLLILYDATPRVAADTEVVSSNVPWFWGTAAYPPGAIVTSVRDTGGTIYAVGDPGEQPPPLPAGYSWRSSLCAFQVCVNAYARQAAG
jgi:mannosyltransferase